MASDIKISPSSSTNGQQSREQSNQKDRKNEDPNGHSLPQNQVLESVSESEIKDSLLEKAVDQVNSYVHEIKREICFSIDKSSNQTIISISDCETNEVIRQIDPRVLLHLAENLQTTGQIIKLKV